MSRSLLLSGALLLLQHELRWARQNAAGILIWGAFRVLQKQNKAKPPGPCIFLGQGRGLHAPLHPGEGSLQKLHFHFHLLRTVLTIPPHRFVPIFTLGTRGRLVGTSAFRRS